MPINISSILPTSVDPELFVNRADEVAEMQYVLRRLLMNNDPNETTGVLVQGDSGVGKSIFSRRVVRSLKTELSNTLVVLIVDGLNLTGVRGLLKKMSQVALEEVSRLNDAELLRQARALNEIADYGKITTSQISQITSGATVGGEVGATFWGLLTSKVSSSLSDSKTSSRTEAFEIVVTDDYLGELLNALIQQIQKAGYEVLIFLDNLDRIVRSDSKEEADAIAAFIKEMMTFSSSVLLLNLRTQFAQHTTNRRGLEPIVLEGLKKEALLEILKHRLENANPDEETRKKLNESGFFQIADQLAEVTGNALAYLRWLDFWLSRSTSNNPAQLAQDFKKFIRNHYQGAPLNWLKQAVDILKQAKADGIEYTSLHAMPPEQVAQLERATAIEPDDLMTEPLKRQYRLTHSLDFLLDEQNRFADALK